MSQTTVAFDPTYPTAKTSRPSLTNQLQAAFEHARRLTAMHEAGSVDVAIAWETVEELRNVQRCRQTAAPSSFALYCAANPDAPECRSYDV
ncbi:hypothetical protein IQ265_07120 [Nodosilinea sp. LEGE 06152]|uniref:Calvin cycle protein CP12 n=1 Tax=Nodosilinea sp. LEGE 06152 TaxID=2777966 RepID=UPI00188253C9|nr:CP12 domain-containing protein [Nodosilinea sp. LEGE 06152]MBE9156599.1 hypothetical protein [Nodosilinea sp. LEGE 06152]